MAKEVIKITLKEMADLGYIIGSTDMEEIKIVNVVGTSDMGHDVDLERITNYLSNTIYEPDQFPGLIYRPFNSSLVCLVFSSGKLSMVGGKSEKEIKKVFRSIQKSLDSATLKY